MNKQVNLQKWVDQVEQIYSQIKPAQYGRVGVLLGGRSGEREISLQSGKGVLDALQGLGIDAHPYDPGTQDIAAITQEKFARVFITLHGRYGEDGTMQGFLEQIEMPYTGSGVLASAMAIDKQVTKNIWLSQGLATPKFLMLNEHSNWEAVVNYLGLPLIVKPAREGSSLGLTKVKNISELPEAFALAAKLDRDVMAEQCIVGEELTCPIIGRGKNVQALPMIKIKAPDANYDYHNKYFSDDTQYICPPGLEPELEQIIEDLAIRSYQALGCSGWGRADVMIDQSTRQPYLLEMNTSPGMTSHSLVPMAAKQAGISYEKLVLWILHQTLDQNPNIPFNSAEEKR
jgi:D-alanine-D-alanine ligase